VTRGRRWRDSGWRCLRLPIPLNDYPGMLRNILLAGAIALATALAHAQEIKIGFIDAPRLERESVQGQRLVETLKKEFGAREQEIIAFQARIADERARFDTARSTLERSELITRGNAIAAMMKKSDRMVIAIREDIQRRRNEIAVDFLKDVRAAIKAVAETGNFDLVVQEARFSSSRIDITEQVLAEMAKRAGAAGQ
jgi:outer membrane protein